MTIKKQMSLFDIQELLEIKSSGRFDGILPLPTCSKFFSYFQKVRYAALHAN